MILINGLTSVRLFIYFIQVLLNARAIFLSLGQNCFAFDDRQTGERKKEKKMEKEM